MEQPLIPVENLRTFFGLAKSAFAKKRKMLHNALSSHAGLAGEGAGNLLEAAGISSDRRAQTPFAGRVGAVNGSIPENTHIRSTKFVYKHL